MDLKYYLLLFFGVFFLNTNTIIAQDQKDKIKVLAKIRVVKKDNLVNIYAKAINNSNRNIEVLNYTLFTVKKDVKGNLSKNEQSGKFSILNNNTKTLATLQLNINDKGNITIYLYIKNNKELLSKDKLEITLIEKKYSTANIDEENIELSGLIVENVMTKLGKDFYDYFTQINQLNGIKYPFVILIEEKPSIGGRNSEIDIKIKDEIIYKFRTQPKEEYLLNQAKIANKQIYHYNVKQKLLHKKTQTF